MSGCTLEIQERVTPVKRGEKEVLVQQKVLVQKKNDSFDQRAVDRVTAFTAQQLSRFEAQNAGMSFKEGVSLNPSTQSTVKQKLLYNKEKKLLKKIEEMLSDEPKLSSLVSTAYTRTRVKIPDIVYFEKNLEEQKTKLFEMISTDYSAAVAQLIASGKADEDSITFDRARPHIERIFRNNDQGELNSYIMLFFINEPLAQIFCEMLSGKIFNRSVLRPEVLPNNP